MKPTEIRIGNLLQDSLTGEKLRVSAISETAFVCYVINRKKFPLPDGWKAEPIPIREHLLISAGFIKNGKILKKGFAVNKSIHIKLDGYCALYFNFDCIEIPSSIKSIHELQNLYFSLAGKELMMNI